MRTEKPDELKDEERTRCEIWVSQDRSSSEQTQPGERPAGMPDRTESTRMCHGTDPDDPEMTRYGNRVSQDRLSSGVRREGAQRRTQPGERPAGMPDRTESTGTCHGTELNDSERTRCEIWTRVMGYHRPVSAWNAGKQSEHAERSYFRESRASS